MKKISCCDLIGVDGEKSSTISFTDFKIYGLKPGSRSIARW